MFTGIIQAQGIIQGINEEGAARVLTIHAPFDDLDLGESVAVDGVCLTVSKVVSDGFCCDVSPETMSRTIACHYQVGSRLNLERALRVGDRLSGHWVQGHVDTTLRLAKRSAQQAFETLVFQDVPGHLQSYLIPKGSICVNGVSLTINEIKAESFALMLIPETLKRTGLATLAAGDFVNVEFDYLAKVIVRQYALSEQFVSEQFV